MCPISRALAGIDITLEMPDLMLDDDEDEDEVAETEVPAADRRLGRPAAAG